MAQFITAAPEFILGANPAESAKQCATIFAEAFQEKYFKEKTNNKANIAAAVKYLAQGAPPEVTAAFGSMQQSVLNADAQARLTAAFNFN